MELAGSGSSHGKRSLSIRLSLLYSIVKKVPALLGTLTAAIKINKKKEFRACNPTVS
jgi:hypothetical protein